MEIPISPPITNSDSSGEGQRAAKRRQVQNSSAEGSELDATLDVADYFLERFRVGVPGLQQLPLTAQRATEYPNALTKIEELEESICHILSDQGVDFDRDEIELVHRAIPGETMSADDLTLLIEANWKNDADAQAWLNAAHQIKEILMISSSATRNVKIELWSWQLRTLRTIDIVEIGHPLVPIWQERIKPPVLSILERTEKLRNGWTGIDVLRMGYFFEHQLGGTETATPVTISITVEYGLIRKDWVAAEEQIRAFLDVEGLQEVQVEFERGYGAFPVTFDTPSIRESKEDSDFLKEDYPERVCMGADFGPEKYFANGPHGEVVAGPIATIGGYIDIRRNQGEWKKYAITNYHCVREAIEGWVATLNDDQKKTELPVDSGSQLYAIDRRGLGPGYAARETITFESPTRRTHRFSLQWHDKQIQLREKAMVTPGASSSDLQRLQLEIADHRERRARKVEFFDQGKQSFGHLFMCSGFRKRTPDNHRIDIAIIEVNPDRVGDNTVPDASIWRSGFTAPMLGCGSRLNGIASCRDPKSLSEFCYKVGCRTGANTGRYSHIESEVKWKPIDGMLGMKSSSEFIFVSEKSLTMPWTDHGDSGSMVWQQPSRWLGVAWGGAKKGTGSNDNTIRLSYTIDAQDVIDWIEGNKGASGDAYEASLPES